ncbi:MAG: tetratricopeptide repeat protein [Parvibaculum sp.]|nr:tetratricopeptide repeat protein [Parvibaculum sp.]
MIVPTGIAVCVIALAIPRIAAYSMTAPWAEVVPAALEEGRMIEPRIFLDDAVSDFKRAVGYHGSDAVLLQDLARLHSRQEDWTSAEEDLRLSLAAAPNRAFVWSLLARASTERGMPPDIVASFVRLSYQTGPREASSVLVRSALIAKNWTQFPEDIQRIGKMDFQNIYDTPWMRREMVQMYLDSDFAGRSAFRDTVLQTPRDARVFDKLLEKSLGLPAMSPRLAH